MILNPFQVFVLLEKQVNTALSGIQARLSGVAVCLSLHHAMPHRTAPQTSTTFFFFLPDLIRTKSLISHMDINCYFCLGLVLLSTPPHVYSTFHSYVGSLLCRVTCDLTLLLVRTNPDSDVFPLLTQHATVLQQIFLPRFILFTNYLTS